MAVKSQPWIRIVTRRIGAMPVGDIRAELDTMDDLCQKFPKDKWELKSTHFIGLEPNGVDVLFVFVEK